MLIVSGIENSSLKWGLAGSALAKGRALSSVSASIVVPLEFMAYGCVSATCSRGGRSAYIKKAPIQLV